MSDPRTLLVEALRRPAAVPAMPLATLDTLVRQARRTNLLAKFAYRLEGEGLLDKVPAAPRAHFLAARIFADKHRRDVHFEIRCLERALAPFDKLILLKGAAYAAADLPAARGRVFSDIDVMVPKARIGEAETALRNHGWTARAVNAYDDRYYRTWMHQIPPLSHFRRETVIDVHHTIVPETARTPVAAEKLFDAAIRLPDSPNMHVLAPADMVLHSAVHLFDGGEFNIGPRDLSDLHDLFTHFGATAGFWPALWLRAQETGLTRSLYLAVHFTRALLGTEVPTALLADLDAYRRAHPALGLLLPLMARGVQPPHRSAEGGVTALARWLLYVRGHYQRMPLRLLIPHLVRKAIVARLPEPAEEKA
jgi:Uncharacterised nucleotidyltransferase